MLREFCQENDVPLRELGKLIVATSERELAGLAEIERRAVRNAVPGIRRLTSAQITDIEPYTRGVAALHSPHTAAVDFVAMCEALARAVTSSGGTVLLRTPVTSVRESADGVRVRSASTSWTFDWVIACAGLTGDRLAAELRRPGDLRIVPFRGEYYELRPAASHRVRGMIYPVPDPRYPFLGVHLTRDVRDHVHVGPNAVLALALEGYRWRDVSPADLARMASWPGSWRLARRHWRSGATEIASSLSKRRYLARVRAYQPDLQLADLVRSTSGVRAQAVSRDGGLVDDFALQAEGRILLVRNAPSPAATASLAIAEHVVTSAVAAAGPR